MCASMEALWDTIAGEVEEAGDLIQSIVAQGLAVVAFFALDSSNYKDFDWTSVNWHSITDASFVYRIHLLKVRYNL